MRFTIEIDDQTFEVHGHVILRRRPRVQRYRLEGSPPRIEPARLILGIDNVLDRPDAQFQRARAQGAGLVQDFGPGRFLQQRFEPFCVVLEEFEQEL